MKESLIPSNELSKEIAFDSLRKFIKEKPFLIFGTGMSCVVDTCFGGHSRMALNMSNVVGHLSSIARDALPELDTIPQLQLSCDSDTE